MSSIHDNFIGERIKELRRDDEMTQTELGEAAGGISTSFISDIERGRTNPSIEVLVAILSVFDITIAEFFRGAEYALTPTEREMIDAMRSHNMTKAVRILAGLSLAWESPANDVVFGVHLSASDT